MDLYYYKVTDKESELYKKANKFLNMEQEFRNTQNAAVKAKVPSFTLCQTETGFNRIAKYVGFVFEDQDNIDKKVWSTKTVDGKPISYPNKRTKAGKEMAEFLENFKRTNCWDVDTLLNIQKTSKFRSFYPANLFKHNDCIYIMIDARFHNDFEKNNADAVEITTGEMDKAIDDYKNA